MEMIIIAIVIAVLMLIAAPYVIWRVVTFLPRLLWACSKTAAALLICGVIGFGIYTIGKHNEEKLEEVEEVAPKVEEVEPEIVVCEEEPPKAVVVKPEFPKHWGEPPAIQTKDYRKLPDPYGYGSSTLYHWIKKQQDADNSSK